MEFSVHGNMRSAWMVAGLLENGAPRHDVLGKNATNFNQTISQEALDPVSDSVPL